MTDHPITITPNPHRIRVVLGGTIVAENLRDKAGKVTGARFTTSYTRIGGVTRDLRKDEPYLAYADYDFKVCCATAGDCYARYLVRMEEMRESLRILNAAIENIPAGDVNVAMDERVARPTKRAGKGYLFTGHHEIMVPLLCAIIKDRLRTR